MKNGELLRRAAGRFDVFLTVDRGLTYQQVVPPNLAMITIQAPSNEIDALRPLLPALLSALAAIKPGERVAVPL